MEKRNATTELRNGIQQGAESKQIEIAKKMLEEKMDISLIIKLTGLTKEEISKITLYKTKK